MEGRIIARVTPSHRLIRGLMTYEEYTELRKKAGVTEYRVAKDCKTGNAFFYKWRTGMIKPEGRTIERITEYLEKFLTEGK